MRNGRQATGTKLQGKRGTMRYYSTPKYAARNGNVVRYKRVGSPAALGAACRGGSGE